MLAAALVLASALAAGQEGPVAHVSQLAWMAGCWEIARADGGVEEQWMAPRGGIMLGMSRTTRGDRATAQEFAVIRVVDGRLVYEAMPGGQAPVTFSATSVSPTRAIFENPMHDYPRRIIYQRSGDLLTASVDDGKGGSRMEYPFRRAACGK
jgi:hypothetical protein